MWQRFREDSQAVESPSGEKNSPHLDSNSKLERCNHDGAAFGLSELRLNLYRSAPDIPHSVYVPQNYERNYQYPTVVYLHENTDSELNLQNWFPQISEMNYLGLGVRAPFPLPSGLPGHYVWDPEKPDASIAAMSETFAAFADDWNLHPARTILFGEGAGAIVALQFFLMQQHGFCEEMPQIAGVVCLSPPANWEQHLPPLPNSLSGRLLLLNHSFNADENPTINSLRAANVLVSEGSNDSQSASSAINHWMMATISSAIF